MQIKTTFFSISYMLAPIILFGFLVDLKVLVQCDPTIMNATFTTNSDFRTANINHITTSTNHNISSNITNDCYEVNPRVYLAKWSFVISGAMFVVPCCLLVFVSFFSQRTKLRQLKIMYTSLDNLEVTDSDMTSEILSKKFFCCTVLLTFFNAVAVGSFLQYLQSFATLHIGWEVEIAALLK